MKCQIYLSISDSPPNFLIAKQAFSSRPFHPVSAHSTQSYILRLRMERAKEESDGMDKYDYLIINDDLDTCVKEVHQIIQGEHRRSFRNTTFIEQMKRELKGE